MPRSVEKPASSDAAGQLSRFRWADVRWADIRWVVLSTAAVVAFVFGCIGYSQYYHHLTQINADDAGPTASDVVYRSLALFLPATAPETGLPIWLDIARFLAPMVAGYAALAGLAALFRDRVQQMRIPFMRNHVVVCGLGYVGGVFLRHLKESKVKVVAVELDPANPLIELCRSLRIPVIVGDAQLERTLHAAGVQRAANLVAVCDVDAVNTQIIAVARQLATGRRKGELNCLARIGDPDLCALLRIQELNLSADSTSSLDFFNTDEIGARLWLQNFPVAPLGGQPHLLVSRLDGLGNWVIKHAARTWYDERAQDIPLWVTVVDDDAGELVRALVDQSPALETACRFICVSASDRQMHQLPKIHDEAGAPPLTRAYVAAYRDEDALEAALELRNALDRTIPLVVALSRAHGVGRLINDASANGTIGSINIEMFPTLERICTNEFVKGGSFEPIAVALHEHWRREKIGAGEDAPAWGELDESRKASSRGQARDITVKMQGLGCTISPLSDWAAKDFAFNPDEIERLGRDEHDRWIRERRDDGWRQVDGKEPDPVNKTTPYLVPFDELPAHIAEFDRVFVRAIPGVMAAAGFQIDRPSAVESSGAEPAHT
jgi:hypothetical protein